MTLKRKRLPIFLDSCRKPFSIDVFIHHEILITIIPTAMTAPRAAEVRRFHTLTALFFLNVVAIDRFPDLVPRTSVAGGSMPDIRVNHGHLFQVCIFLARPLTQSNMPRATLPALCFDFIFAVPFSHVERGFGDSSQMSVRSRRCPFAAGP